MTPTIYYTIIARKHFFLVKYAIAPACKILTFPGTFADPGEASQELKKAMQGELSHLTEAAFGRKVSELSSQYQQDLAKLAAWNSGKAIRI